MPLSTANDCQALLFGDFRGRHNLPTAGHVRSNGLLGKDVLACLDGGHHLPAAECRGGRHTQQVRLAFGQLLVAVEAPEKMVVVDIHATFEFVIPQEPVPGFPDLTLEQVSQGDDLHARIGLQVLPYSAVAASAAPEQPHLDSVRPSRVNLRCNRTGQCHCGSSRGRVFTHFLFVFF